MGAALVFSANDEDLVQVGDVGYVKDGIPIRTTRAKVDQRAEARVYDVGEEGLDVSVPGGFWPSPRASSRNVSAGKEPEKFTRRPSPGPHKYG